MFYEQKNTNHPMIVLVKNNYIRQGGWYGHQYNDMDVADPAILSCFHPTRSHHLYATDGGLDSMHRQTNGSCTYQWLDPTGRIDFSTANLASTDATFNQAGIYYPSVLVHDTANNKYCSASVKITVYQAASGEDYWPFIVVNAGDNQQVSLPASGEIEIDLSGDYDDNVLDLNGDIYAVDDPDGDLDYIWSIESGPISAVDFGHVEEVLEAPGTTVTFSQAGIYILGLKAVAQGDHATGLALGYNTVKIILVSGDPIVVAGTGYTPVSTGTESWELDLDKAEVWLPDNDDLTNYDIIWQKNGVDISGTEGLINPTITFASQDLYRACRINHKLFVYRRIRFVYTVSNERVFHGTDYNPCTWRHGCIAKTIPIS